jgi:hypothetical protein
MLGWKLLLYSLAVLLAIAAGWTSYVALWRDRARGRRRCPRCWYDLSGTAALQCPECGRTARSERKLRKRRRRPRLALLSLVFLLLAYASSRVPPAIATGKPLAMLPGTLVFILLNIYDDGGGIVFERFQAAAMHPSKLYALDRFILGHTCARQIEKSLDAAGAQPTRRLAFATTLVLPLATDREGTCLNILAQLGPYARPAVPALVRMVRENNQNRGGAMHVLGRIGARSAAAARECLPPLLEAIAANGLDAPPCMDAVSLMGRHAIAAGPTVRMWVERNPAQGFRGSQTLASIGAVHDLAMLLDRSHPLAREYGVRGLHKLGAAAQPTTSALIAAISDTHPPVRAFAVETLGLIGPPARAALPELDRARRTDSNVIRVRLSAVISAGQIGAGTPDAVPLLTAALTDDYSAVRNAAARELERLGPLAAPARDALLTLSTVDEYAFIREAAEDALRAISRPAALAIKR